MKNLFLLIAFLSATAIAKTQGNLQFNQVLSYTGSLSCNTIGCGLVSLTPYTVPNGKVWKIENVGYNANQNGGYFSQAYLIINGVAAYCGLSGTGQDVNTTGKLLNAPVWLKAGDILNIGMTSNAPTGSFTYRISYHISIIEFNIIP